MSDFFTRLIELNTAGLNVGSAPQNLRDVVQAWACHSCDDVHDREREAKACCPASPSVQVWVCPECNQGSEAPCFAALVCCQGLADPEPQPVRKQWGCGTCDEVYETETGADSCCRAKADMVYLCAACNQAQDSEEDARECCADEVGKCLVCQRSGYPTYLEAVDCCLVLHPTLTTIQRQRMAKFLEAGQDWPTALKSALASPPFH